MSKANLEQIALAGLVAVEAAHAYSAFLPSIFTIKRLAVEKYRERGIRALRQGYVPATLFAIILGVIVSIIAKHPLPLLFAIFTAIFMVSVYEHAIRTAND